MKEIKEAPMMVKAEGNVIFWCVSVAAIVGRVYFSVYL